MTRVVRVIVVLVAGFFYVSYAGFSFRGTSSYVRVAAGATFLLNKPLTVDGGTIIKDAGATITGVGLTFVNGVYQYSDGSVALNGALDPVGTVTLNGQAMYVDQSVQTIYVQGAGNRIEGSPRFSTDLTLRDFSTTLTIALASAVNKNIVMQSGTLILDNHLYFADSCKLVGPGTIINNGYSVFLGAKPLAFDTMLTWSNASALSCSGDMVLTNQWQFCGTGNVINGNGHTLTLQGSGSILVAHGSTLLLKNITITGVAGNNIACVDDTGIIILDGVTWKQDGLFTFAYGACEYKNNVKMIGEGAVFAYQTAMTSTIHSRAALIFDQAFTFSYDPCVVASKDLLAFENETATLVLIDSTLHTTGTGINLTKGKLRLLRAAGLSSEIVILDDGQQYDTGITFGDGLDEENDLRVEVEGSASLTVQQGSLNYKNISATSFSMDSLNCRMNMGAGTILRLYTSINVNPGMVYFGDNTVLMRGEGKDLVGSVITAGAFVVSDIIL